MARNRNEKRADVVAPLLALVGLYWFASSFFLAKRSLSDASGCDEAPRLLAEYLGLTEREVDLVLKRRGGGTTSDGCWLDRRVDTLVILVVDALRFDFARNYLPLSITSRIGGGNGGNSTTSSQLLQFVADPPTVTMQRLKGLTTGGLPTFADISGNFGGAAVDEDTWIQQMVETPHWKRGLKHPSRRGFVGDDTWVDLFPTQFQESYPYPSFNTRDLDTVDNGCLHHLPTLLSKLRKIKDGTDDDEGLELLVAHFLGVDHVGHTYGPHDRHMTEKLQQVDAALSTTLDLLDESRDCHLALVFGDHGMTEDGNHGGGTEEEVNAALFVHFSPACGAMSLDVAPRTGSKYIEEAFQSIHQIDLVPTISVLLGLPIPYANIGGIAPSLLGLGGIRETTAALALNAAQVWRYFTIYSATANTLPNLPELGERLEEAVATYKDALAHADGAEDSNAFYKACGLFKIFLAEASELGHRVWTRFDSMGMILGGAVVFVALAITCASMHFGASGSLPSAPRRQTLEIGLAAAFGFFQICMLTFSNSYIEAEQNIVMFEMSLVYMAMFLRMNAARAGGNARIVPFAPLIIPLLSRIAETFVSGHGLDPSIRLHQAHNPLMFVPALAGLVAMRVHVYRVIASKSRDSQIHCLMDCLFICVLAFSWLEKRALDQSRNGFFGARICVALLLLGTPATLSRAMMQHANVGGQNQSAEARSSLENSVAIASKLLLALMLVTGPATGPSVFIIAIQGWMLFVLGGTTGFYEVSPFVQAMLWRFLVRHIFFATNHGCAFNRLHYSAAFISTVEFDFVMGGLQLFINTFGWEIVGLVAVRMTSSFHRKPGIWRWYCIFQLLETFVNCISVSVLRRHLMVWAIYAPRFLFSAIFLILNSMGQVAVFLLSASSA